MQGGGYLNAKDYDLLNGFICSRYDSYNNCPLNKYSDCDVEPTAQTLVEIAKKIVNLPNNDELALSQIYEEEARKILARYRKAAVI